ncbi:Rcat domain-containing protein [Aspergillus nidulans FGSC A4]|uniref:RING-type domain-containing protein n=1 Tax=Emericella nidulans (strain FGSC A4 / ATCC 38163 / CBS 112.46 / NRRL 194 / M139) TaxID=227321 RepID=C8VSB8_EMENI|nr:hypothetical protein [Aspergillus nidulans FGSC A4]CBF89173.1 TPA: hypothetical protein ANIA_10100 [Aspergillus nidulans FGSC A4]
MHSTPTRTSSGASSATLDNFTNLGPNNRSLYATTFKEQRRQDKMHEAQKTAARKRQEKEAARVREKRALEQAQAEAAQGQGEEDDEPIEEEVKDDFKEKIEMLKRRMREVELSMKKVEETTKRCPGCQWPIEKNDGCDHMTCKHKMQSRVLLDLPGWLEFAHPQVQTALLVQLC